MDWKTIISGMVIGFSIAAPVGPIGILCIRRTLAYGRIAGLVSGLGAATADAFYGSLAALGLSFVIEFFVKQQSWLQFVGGLFLCFLGVKTFVEKNLSPAQPLLEVSNSIEIKNNKFRARSSDYFSTFFLTLTNPLTILSFAAIFAGIGMKSFQGSTNPGMLVVAGVFLGSTAWWLLLSTIADMFRARLISQKIMRWINRISGIILLGFGIVALAASLPKFFDDQHTDNVQAQLMARTTPMDTSLFNRVVGPNQLVFPRDHGPHPDYLTEWWYFTGNLDTPAGRHFGYQLTFFRRALVPPQLTVTRTSGWASSQAYLAHFAIADVQGGKHEAFEQLSRGALGLAGAQSYPFQVWLYGWNVSQEQSGDYKLTARQGEMSLELTMKDIKGPVLHGDRGYSQKSTELGQASMYYSLTRLDSAGTLTLGGRSYPVNGLSWMDHEYSTSALSSDQVGWDWFSFQMDDGSELMLFQIRRKDGSIDPFSSGTIIGQDGSIIRLEKDDFSIEILETWKSPTSQAVYPAGWVVHVLPVELELHIQPYLADQELNLRYVYWEGCVKIDGKRGEENVSGSGYVELTGYAGSMAGEF